MQWFLISGEDVAVIGAALDSAQRLAEENCNYSGCMCDVYGGPTCGAYYARARHALDSGLNTTDAVPLDFAEENSGNDEWDCAAQGHEWQLTTRHPDPPAHRGVLPNAICCHCSEQTWFNLDAKDDEE